MEEARNFTVVPNMEFSTETDSDGKAWRPDWDTVRQMGVEDMKRALTEAHDELEAAANWARTLSVVPDHVRPMIIDLARKTQRVLLEVADLK